jgi:hypothetical protein
VAKPDVPYDISAVALCTKPEVLIRRSILAQLVHRLIITIVVLFLALSSHV